MLYIYENLLNESLAWHIFTISFISSLSSSPSDSLLDNSLSNSVHCPGAMALTKDNFNRFSLVYTSAELLTMILVLNFPLLSW